MKMSFQFDPFGITCFVFLYCLIFYVDYVCLFQVLSLDQADGQQVGFYILAGGYQLVLFMVVWCHCKCLFTDPGVWNKSDASEGPRVDTFVVAGGSACEDVEYNGANKVHQKESLMTKRNYTLEFEWTFCQHCKIHRPPRCHHCHICKSCILKMDHHCPWVNNCVGEYNLKYFLQFVSYSFLGSLYTLANIIISFVFIQEHTPVKIIHIALLILSSVIFGIFALAVLCDQVSGIFHDQTSIERLRGEKGPKKNKMRMLRQTCGHMSFFLWLFPLPLERSNKMDKEVNIDGKAIQSYAL